MLELPLHLVGNTGDYVLDQLRRVADLLDLLNDEVFDLFGRNRFRWTGMPAAFLCGCANIVAIAFVTAFGRMVWSHGTVAADTTNQSLEQSPKLVSNHDATGSTVVLQLLLYLLPQLGRYDRVVFAFVDLIFVADFAKVGDVREQLEQRTLVEVPTAAFFAALGNGQLVLPTASIDLLDCLNDRLALEIQFEGSKDLCGLVFVDDDLSTFAIVVIRAPDA